MFPLTSISDGWLDFNQSFIFLRFLKTKCGRHHFYWVSRVTWDKHFFFRRPKVGKYGPWYWIQPVTFVPGSVRCSSALCLFVLFSMQKLPYCISIAIKVGWLGHFFIFKCIVDFNNRFHFIGFMETYTRCPEKKCKYVPQSCFNILWMFHKACTDLRWIWSFYHISWQYCD